MRRPLSLSAALAATLCLLPWTPRALAQDAPPPATSPQPSAPTLAQALAQAEAPRDTVYLAVGAEKTTRPKDTDPAPLPPGAAILQVAGAYGRMAQNYETVTALAPPTMTVVYAPPDTPNPYDGMPPGQVLKLLAVTFSPDQWKAFFGPSGLGYGDLQTDAQRSLFGALFPGGHLVAQKDLGDPKTKQDISGDALLQAHLRLGYIVALALQMADKPDSHLFAGGPDLPNAPTRYYMVNGQSQDVDREFGAQVRETGPNTLKAGDLDTEALTAPVPLSGARTVDDLVTRIGLATHRELYADARYGARTVTLIGPASARAGDLLRALALCLTGTYRKVGPAYILTDDLIGLGTKHVLWKAFEDKAQALLPGGTDPFTSPTPSKAPYTIQDIPWGDDTVAFTADQQKQFWKQWRANPMQGGSGILDLTLPFAQLSPAQQEASQLLQEDYQKRHLGTTLDGTVMVQAQPEMELTLPSLDGPVIVFDSYDNLLPYPSLTPAEEAANGKQMQAQMPFAFGQNTSAPQGPLRPVIRGFTRRAVRLAPHDATELARALAAMKALGFNELWLEITPGSQASDDDKALALLTQAVKRGKADGIAVLTDLHLLRWAAGAPPGLWDKDILGRTATESNKAARFPTGEVHDTVTPFAPEVWGRLAALARAAGGTPGIGGMVWEDLVPTGYETFAPGDPEGSGFATPLGYAEAGRLALLRAARVDPVDLYTNRYTDERAHVSVPGFDTDFTLNRALYDRWRGLRAGEAQALARQLSSLLPPGFRATGAPYKPLLVPPANVSFTSLYGSWDDFRRPPPSEEFIAPRGPDGQVLMGVPSTERMPSALSYRPIGVYEAPDASQSRWAEAAARALRAAARGTERNVVLDAAARPGLLDALAAAEPPPTGGR